jgi:hypothetical protein
MVTVMAVTEFNDIDFKLSIHILINILVVKVTSLTDKNPKTTYILDQEYLWFPALHIYKKRQHRYKQNNNNNS